MFETVSINRVVSWHFAHELDVCAVCKYPCHDRCPTCTASSATCTLVKSQCGHVFHTECIRNWLATNNICPLCTAEWKEAP
ncbi:RING-H2 zinc finger domain-containing protein [Giardia muris]|uniref:RING-H2 zinc finger domain-containing protein n=1 Tax=Giardia muris TaxID=5742 RepID=A0A4Z1SZD6_GIAMU|nr:RING-H2 zinc finger domain-containing protein [Giardia muris]|eukprot:TNJ28838.1 RING-H2 zinc finger domain-containing protein [Giardia muris]